MQKYPFTGMWLLSSSLSQYIVAKTLKKEYTRIKKTEFNYALKERNWECFNHIKKLTQHLHITLNVIHTISYILVSVQYILHNNYQCYLLGR
jgi:hypothetical protein